jgi:endonuclease-3 related protein
VPPLADLCAYYEVLRVYYPGNDLERFESRPPFERALAAFVGFGKAERVFGNLRACLPAGEELTPASLAGLSDLSLEKALRPSGFAGNKVRKVRGLLKVMARGGLSGDAKTLWQELVSTRGIGRESADAVLLHALDYPVFAVNTQTYRLLRRHGFVGEETVYAEMQELFHAVLPEKVKVYKEYYHLIRQVAEEFCRAAKAACADCPLKGYMEYEPDN